jgi:hypothetical protein
MLIQAIDYMEYDFSSLPIAASMWLKVGEIMDVSQFLSGTMLVRIHSIDVDAGASFDIYAYSYWPSSREPNVEFKVGTAVAQVQLDSTHTAGDVLTYELDAGFGPFIGVSINAVQAGQVGDVKARISVGFLLFS